MAEYEDNSVAESGAVKGLSNFAVMAAKFLDYLGSVPAALGAGASSLFSLTGGGIFTLTGGGIIGWLDSKLGFLPEAATPMTAATETVTGMFTSGNVVAAGAVGVARGVEAANELFKGNKLKATNLTIKGAAEAAVVFAEIGTLGMTALLLEPLSFFATGKAISTHVGDAAAKMAENIEESIIGSSAKKKADAKIAATVNAGQAPAQSFAQQAAPIMMVPMMMAQNMQPATLPTQPVIQPQVMPYVVQQTVAAPGGESPKPTGYWVNKVSEPKQQQQVVAAVPQEAAAFNHAVKIAEQKAASATQQQTV